MKVEVTRRKIVLIGVPSILLSITIGGTALAGISKEGPDEYCNLCHTDGNGTNGTTTQTCVECHSSALSSTTYELVAGSQTVTVPVVYYTGVEAPTTHLAGGNFYSVSRGGTENDKKGHNVEGIAGGRW